MSGKFRTYRGAHGETIRVPEGSFAALPKLHSEAQRFPFAALAGRMGDQRDRFAKAVSFTAFFEEAMARRDVQRILAL